MTIKNNNNNNYNSNSNKNNNNNNTNSNNNNDNSNTNNNNNNNNNYYDIRNTKGWTGEDLKRMTTFQSIFQSCPENTNY